jgi:ParB family chromosome partitioning protein
LAILFGVMKPEEVQVHGGEASAPRKSAATPAPAPEEPAISNALVHRLSVRLTQAAGLALSQDLELSLIVLLAGLACHDDNVKLSVRGLSASTMDLTGTQEVVENISLLRKMTLQERMALIPSIAAAALNFETRTLEMDPDDKFNTVRAICDAIEPKSLNAALRGAFDAKDYFNGVAKALCLTAIDEALGPDLARQQSKNPKGDIAAFAIANVPTTGWLPPQLRAKGYDGPPVKKGKVVALPAAKGKAKPPAKKAAPVKRAAAAKKPAKKTSAKKAKKR